MPTPEYADEELKKWEISGVLASLFDEYELYRTSELPFKIETEATIGNWQFDLFKSIVDTKPINRIKNRACSLFKM